MIGNNIWTDDVRSKLLHILPQDTYHGEAEIRGSKDALLRLADALTDAAEKGQCSEVKVEMMVSDGEGYWVIIRAMSDQQISEGPLPYAQLGQFWDFDRCDDCPKAAT